MVLTRLAEKIKSEGLTPEELAAKSKGDFSNMTVRRAIKGMGIDRLKAAAIAKALKTKLECLI